MKALSVLLTCLSLTWVSQLYAQNVQTLPNAVVGINGETYGASSLTLWYDASDIDGDIAEVIFYQDALDDCAVFQVNDYLGKK